MTLLTPSLVGDCQLCSASGYISLLRERTYLSVAELITGLTTYRCIVLSVAGDHSPHPLLLSPSHM